LLDDDGRSNRTSRFSNMDRQTGHSSGRFSGTSPKGDRPARGAPLAAGGAQSRVTRFFSWLWPSSASLASMERRALDDPGLAWTSRLTSSAFSQARRAPAGAHIPGHDLGAPYHGASPPGPASSRRGLRPRQHCRARQRAALAAAAELAAPRGGAAG
jgi:hypothetical protein